MTTASNLIWLIEFMCACACTHRWRRWV